MNFACHSWLLLPCVCQDAQAGSAAVNLSAKAAVACKGQATEKFQTHLKMGGAKNLVGKIPVRFSAAGSVLFALV